ncbi:MAG: hypothetical protein HOC70_17075 [Gammaproteobacteria bacterium]|jgi:hypothetical protein|nr:hypothetical protein [Gammaproteobacteria bacterium]MBT4494958.1 hypothetical protein [Gammaproteobacteria bacterium]MBT7370682.1 hypothetical protein [Gammaproteobacteria bacterium]
MIRFVVGLVLLALSAGLHAGGLDGDAKALERVEAMLVTIGGREVWAKARSLYTVERARHPAYGDGIEASFWRNLEEPGEYAHLIHTELDVNYGWNTEGGWISRNGELRDFTKDEMTERRFYWDREVYTLYHQLAKGERKLTVRSVEPNGFYVLDDKGEKIGIFRLTADGDLYLWEQIGGDDPVAYVYGPHKDFGRVSFPDWGTATDGGWGFYYIQVRPSPKHFSANVDIAKPVKEWSGGAIRREKWRE